MRRVLLLGAGKAGTAIASALVLDPRVEMVGISAGSGASAQKLGARFRTPVLPELSPSEITGLADVVVIASPHALHVRQALAALEGGADVLIEKPVALTPGELQAITDTCRRSKGRVFCAMTQRCDPSMLDCRSYVADRADQIVAISASQYLHRDAQYYETWKGDPHLAGGGVLVNQAIHALDLALFLASETPARVRGTMARRRATNVEDWISANLELVGGAPLSLTATTAAATEDAQVVRILLGDETIVVVGSETPRWRAVTAPCEGAIAELSTSPVPLGAGHAAWVGDALDALEGSVPSRYRCELADVAPTHHAVFALYSSHAAGGVPVEIDVRAGH